MISLEMAFEDAEDLVKELGEGHWATEQLAPKLEEARASMPWSHRDRLAAQVYQARAQSPREQTRESWARVCDRFKGSAKQCYDEVDRMVEEGELALEDD